MSSVWWTPSVTNAGNPDLKVILLVDSVEQIRGVGTEATNVHDSVVNLFSGQAASLAFPKLHVVYTIPPYLLALSQNLGRTLGGHPIVSWPNIHVRRRDGNPDSAGLGIMERIIDKRYAGWRDIIPADTLRHLAGCAGGDLRDFFRLVGECVIALSTARRIEPEAVLTEAMVTRVEEQLRNELCRSPRTTPAGSRVSIPPKTPCFPPLMPCHPWPGFSTVT